MGKGRCAPDSCSHWMPTTPGKGHELGWGSCLLLGAVPSSQLSTGSSGENKSFIWEEESRSTAQHPPPWSCSWPEANNASLGQVSTRQQSCGPCAIAGAMFSRPTNWKASTTTWNQLIQLSANFQRPGNTGCFASTTHGNGHQLPSHSPCSLPYGIFRVVSLVLGNQPQPFFLRHTIIARHSHSLWRVMPTLVRAMQCFFFWSMIAFQCCVELVSAIQQHESAIIIHICPPSWTFLQPTPSHPSRSLQSTKLSSLCYIAASHYLFYTW